MPRQTPLTDKEAAQLQKAVSDFEERIKDAYGDVVTTRAIPGGDNSDIEVKLNTREFPAKTDGPLRLDALFAAAHDLGFEPVDGVGYTVADIGTANTSSRLSIDFAYTYE